MEGEMEGEREGGGRGRREKRKLDHTKLTHGQ